jgi:hypothetical protein
LFIEKQLDRGLGSCWLRRHDIGQLVADALQHFTGDRYELPKWCGITLRTVCSLTPTCCYFSWLGRTIGGL